MGSILDKTVNIFDLYQYICGKSDVPPIYNFWACVAGISATLSKNCWFELIRNIPIMPNLYVGLLGDGSIGKGVAMSRIADIVRTSTTTNIFRGGTTKQALQDMLSKPTLDENGRKVPPRTDIWLIHDELSDALGTNKGLVEDVVRILTNAYTGSHFGIDFATRTHGKGVVDKSCISWLFGTTEDWLRKCIDKTDLQSGFLARCHVVEANYNFDNRLFRPQLPDDYDEIYHHLQLRFYMLSGYRGEFRISEEADEMLDEWWAKRPPPEDELMNATWWRHREMILRFGMINSVADGGKMVITKTHILRSLSMLKQTFICAERLLRKQQNTSYEARIIDEVEKLLKQRKVMKKCELTKTLNSRRKYTSKQVLSAVSELISLELLEIGRSNQGGIIYIYKG